jgi:hypothetical protein
MLPTEFHENCFKKTRLIRFYIHGNVGKSRQRRSRYFAVLTHSMYAPRVKMAAALLDALL